MLLRLNQTEVLAFTPQDLDLSVDWILQGQGADPAGLRARRPQLVKVAERALQEGMTVLQPRCALLLLEVDSLAHDRLNLRPQGYLSGQAVGQHLAGARQAALMVYSVGEQIEQRIQQTFSTDPPFSLALDGLANAAMDALGNRLYELLQREAEHNGWQLSIFLSPGMVGWSMEQGQAQIFRLLQASLIGVQVNSAWLMIPRKSTSAVVGLGPGLVPAQGPPCEYCAINDTCRFKGRHTH